MKCLKKALAWRAVPHMSRETIRAAVIFRKVTYCFRSAWGAQLYADIRSVIETGRRRAIDAFEAIRLTLQAKPLAAPAPS
jgi:transposase